MNVYRPSLWVRFIFILIALGAAVASLIPGEILSARLSIVGLALITAYPAVAFNRALLRFDGRAIVIRRWREVSYDSHDAIRFRSERNYKGYAIWLDFQNGGSLVLGEISAGLMSEGSAQRKAKRLNHDLEIARHQIT